MERKSGVVTVMACPPPVPSLSGPSHLDALHSLIDGLEQRPVLRVLVAVFIGKHVGQGFHVAVEVLL